MSKTDKRKDRGKRITSTAKPCESKHCGSKPCEYRFEGKLTISGNPHSKVFNLYRCLNCQNLYLGSSNQNLVWLARKLELSMLQLWVGKIHWKKFRDRLKKKLNNYNCNFLMKKGAEKTK